MVKVRGQGSGWREPIAFLAAEGGWSATRRRCDSGYGGKPVWVESRDILQEDLVREADQL